MPDSLLARAISEKETVSSLEARGGLETPGGATTDLTDIGKGRRTVVQIQLERMADSVSGQTVRAAPAMWFPVQIVVASLRHSACYIHSALPIPCELIYGQALSAGTRTQGLASDHESLLDAAHEATLRRGRARWRRWWTPRAT